MLGLRGWMFLVRCFMWCRALRAMTHDGNKPTSEDRPIFPVRSTCYREVMACACRALILATGLFVGCASSAEPAQSSAARTAPTAGTAATDDVPPQASPAAAPPTPPLPPSLSPCMTRADGCAALSPDAFRWEIHPVLRDALDECNDRNGTNVLCAIIDVEVDAEGCPLPAVADHHAFELEASTLACIDEVLATRRFACAVGSGLRYAETCTN